MTSRYFVDGDDVIAFHSSGNDLVVFAGKQAETLVRRIIPNQMASMYADEIAQRGFKDLGTAMINERGRVISTDLKQTLYWQLTDENEQNVNLFKNHLKVFFESINNRNIEHSLEYVEAHPTLHLKLTSNTTVGIDYKQSNNIFTLTGKGTGSISYSTSPLGIWLLLFLHKNKVILLSDTDKEFSSLSSYPKWLHQLMNNDNDLKQLLGLGLSIDNIKPRKFKL